MASEVGTILKSQPVSLMWSDLLFSGFFLVLVLMALIHLSTLLICGDYSVIYYGGIRRRCLHLHDNREGRVAVCLRAGRCDVITHGRHVI